MYTSQFQNYDWFCGPGSHLAGGGALNVFLCECVCVCVCVCDRWVEQQCTAGLVSHCGGWRSIERRRNVAPLSVCVKSRWRKRRRRMMMMEESDSIPCTAEDGLLSSWRWNRTARDQVQIKQKIRDLPGLLKHGLNLRKKSVSYQNYAW